MRLEVNIPDVHFVETGGDEHTIILGDGDASNRTLMALIVHLRF